MDAPIKLPVEKHSELVAAAKHMLALARSGRILAIGYAVLTLDDDGDVSAGTNAVWADNTQLREGLKTALGTLETRIGGKRPLIIQ